MVRSRQEQPGTVSGEDGEALRPVPRVCLTELEDLGGVIGEHGQVLLGASGDFDHVGDREEPAGGRVADAGALAQFGFADRADRVRWQTAVAAAECAAVGGGAEQRLEGVVVALSVGAVVALGGSFHPA